jgi:hypothetical protein
MKINQQLAVLAFFSTTFSLNYSSRHSPDLSKSQIKVVDVEEP